MFLMFFALENLRILGITWWSEVGGVEIRIRMHASNTCFPFRAAESRRTEDRTDVSIMWKELQMISAGTSVSFSRTHSSQLHPTLSVVTTRSYVADTERGWL